MRTPAPFVSTPRRGVALLAAISLMVLIALLVMGGVASFATAQRASRLTHTDGLLSAAADYALHATLSSHGSARFSDATLGMPYVYDVQVPDATGIRVTVTVTRLRGGTLWLVADAALGGLDSGRRRVNLVARFPWVGSAPGSPIVARGGVHLDDAVAFVTDTSSDPECDNPALADVAGGPGATTSAALGVRAVTLSAAGDSGTYFLTNHQLSELRGNAAFHEVLGDTVIASGTFEGVLIVDGDLTVAGPFSATGLLVARGRITVPTGGLSLAGAMMSFARPPDDQPAIDIRGGSIRYSRCVIERALRRASEPRPVQKRSWAELF
jgi:hypothetical protein